MDAMMRSCDGRDPNLRDEDGAVDNCGLVFDDVARSTIHPHVFIPSREDKARILAMFEEMVVEQAASR
jgi:hypothetical protein